MCFYGKRLLFSLLFIIATFVVKGQPVASFTTSADSGCAPLVVHFTNTSTGATSYHWNLGNGTISAAADSVAGSYLTVGSYTATLTAYNGSDSSTSKVVITVFPIPTVYFSAGDSSVCPGASVTFTSTSISGSPGAVTYSWNFGDGTSSSATMPSHTFPDTGYYNITLSVKNSVGCVSAITKTAYVHINPLPIPSFSASPTSFCSAPGIVNFTDTTIGTPPYSYTWAFGDGTTSTGSDPVHTYTATGTYSVKLIVTDGPGCIDSISRTAYITVDSLKASFTGPDSGCVSSPIIFKNTSSSHIASNWNFGDGSTETGETGIHAYLTAGTYTVTLIVYNGGSCYDTVTKSVTTLPAPIDSFSWTTSGTCPAPDTVAFTNTTLPGATYSWNFGDGGTSSATDPSHTYKSNGIFTISLVITDSNGCKSTLVKKDTIASIKAAITVNGPSSTCAPFTDTFSVNVSTPYDSTYPYGIASYSWIINDTPSNATSSTDTTMHTYNYQGNYSVVVTVVTNNGCTVHDTASVKVGEPPIPLFIVLPDTIICYDSSLTFISVSRDTTDSSSYTWTYINAITMATDGTGTGDTTHHHFSVPGVFTVRLVVNNNGCKDTLIKTAYVTIDSPKALMADSFLCYPQTAVQFFDSSLGDDSLLWTFSDGTTSTLKDPLHVFPSLGTDSIRLTTYNVRSGCRDTTRKTIILSKPYIRFSVADTVVCKNTIVSITSTDTGGTPSAYAWSVSPSAKISNSAVSNPTITFAKPGIYTVTLVTTDPEGCFDTLTRNNYIKVGGPSDSFSFTPSNGCVPLAATFTDYTTDISGSTFTSWQWAFGDGTTDSTTSATTTHTYTTAGTFLTREIVTDNLGCKDTLAKTSVTVYKPSASFNASTTHSCVGNPVVFTNTSTGYASSFWMFGDGDTSSATSPVHIYDAPDSYTVKLVITDIHGCTDTATYVDYITVTKPTASFTVSDSFSVCAPLKVQFINTSVSAVSDNWTFGDGNSSVSISPDNLYITPGYYTVELIVKDIFGCPDTSIKHINVYGYTGAFSYKPLSGCAPLTVSFSAVLTKVPNITWDFADGVVSSFTLSDTITHVYTVPGAYLPKLILGDSAGCQNSSLGADTIKVEGVKAGFTTVPNPVCIGDNVTFTDLSKGLFAPIASWHWVLGNGDTSDLQSITNFYANAGTYPIILSVTDAWGCFATDSQNVVVYPLPVITANPDTTVCLGDAAQLQGYGGVSYTWTPSASLNCSSCPSPKASPSAITTYTVKGTDANGCSNTDTVSVFLKYKTISTAKGDTEICRGGVVPLFDSGGTKYTWLPSLGLNNNNLANPTASPDTTTVYLAIAQLAGCIADTNFITVVVHQPPTVDAGSDQTVVAGAQAQLQATGTLISTYEWAPYQPLSCDSCSNPVATMNATTTFTVTVSSSFGCTASDTVTIHVVCDRSQVFIPNSFTPNGDGQNDVFYPRGAGIRLVKTFRIYNRWGELLFERSNIPINDEKNAWDGSYQGSAPRPDVYVYIIDAVCETGEAINIKGDVTIIR